MSSATRSWILSCGLILAGSAAACGTRTDIDLEDGAFDDGVGNPEAPGAPGPGATSTPHGGNPPPGFVPLDDAPGVLVRDDGAPPDEAADFDFSQVEDEALRDRLVRCAGYCDVIQEPWCPRSRLAESFTRCLGHCAQEDGRCGAATHQAFRCVAENIEAVIVCDDRGRAELACGPCDDEFERVANRCDGDSISCQFR